jgi:hypothetical protein
MDQASNSGILPGAENLRLKRTMVLRIVTCDALLEVGQRSSLLAEIEQRNAERIVSTH